MTTATPTPKQLVNRMFTGHARMLKTIRDGGDPFPSTKILSELRGCTKIYRTLVGWGAIESGRLTDLGRELLTMYVDKYPAFKN